MHCGPVVSGPLFQSGGSIPALVNVPSSKTLNPESLPVAVECNDPTSSVRFTDPIPAFQ